MTMTRPALRHRPAGEQPRTGRRPPRDDSFALSALVSALALLASLAGLGVEDAYGDPESVAEMYRGYDLVTALVAVPLLVVAMLAVRRTGSQRARLLQVGMLAYLAYTYAYYVLGTGFTDLFLLDTAVFSAAVWALVLATIRMAPTELVSELHPRARVRAVSSVLMLLALSLGGMWVFYTVDNAVSGDVPPGSALVETETLVALGIALDLALLVPLYAASAALLWRRSPWGHVMAGIALIAGTLHQVSYMVALPFQVAAQVPEAVAFDPFEPVILLLYLIGTFLLLRPRPTTAA